MSPHSRRALFSSLPAAAAAIAGCLSVIKSDEDSLPVDTQWQRRYAKPTQPTTAPDGTLLVGSRSPLRERPLMAAVDQDTGEERWRVQGPEAKGSPVGSDETFAYVLSKHESLLAVRHASGEVVWRATIEQVDAADPGVVEFAPIPVADTVIVPISGIEDDVPDRVVGLNRADGTVRFVHEFPASLAAAPGAIKDGVLVPLLDGTLRRIGLDGSGGWRHSVGAPMSTVAVDGDTAYVGSAMEALLAVTIDTGDLEWESPLENTVFTRPLSNEGRVFVGGADYYLTAVDQATGERQWRSELPNAVTTGPTSVDGRLVTLAGGGTTHQRPERDDPLPADRAGPP